VSKIVAGKRAGNDAGRLTTIERGITARHKVPNNIKNQNDKLKLKYQTDVR
jgi:hypothetical protein